MDDSWVKHPSCWEQISEIHTAAWMQYAPFLNNYWDNDGRISPLSLYCYLKARFGMPNGCHMALRHPTTENIVQWHYVVAHGTQVLHFVAYNDRLRIIPQTEAPLSNDDWLALAEELKREYAKYGRAIGLIRQDMQKWNLFTNPFCRLKDVISVCRTKLELLQNITHPVGNRFASEEDIEAYSSALSKYWARKTELDGNCLTIRMLTPVAAEAFLNLVIYLLAKQSIRDDPSQLDLRIRAQITDRVAELHITCDGFTKSIDLSAQAYKNFLKMMNERNFYLHGNFVPERLVFEDFYTDNIKFGTTEHQIPLFKHDADLAQRLSSGVFKDMQMSHALNDISIVGEFIQLVLSCLEINTRKEIENVMAVTYPARNSSTGEIKSIFPRAIYSAPIAPAQIGGDGH